MKTQKLIEEFTNKFCYGGNLDNRITKPEVEKWINECFISKHEMLFHMKSIRSLCEDGVPDKEKLASIHELADSIIFEGNDW